MEHAHRIERAVTIQAEAFEDASRNQVFTSAPRWVFERLSVRGQTGTGFRPRADADGELWFTQTFGSAIASKPS